MRIFLDTANLDEIREVAGWGILSGVTTNPTLLSKERGDFRRIIEEICEIVQGPVSVEVIAQDVRGMIEEARRYSSWSPHVVIKIPIVPSGLAAISVLSKEGVRVNTTLIFNPIQALLAALAGAAYVSPFLGRVDDISADGLKLLREIVTIFRNDPRIQTEVLAASIRHPMHLVEVAKAGADIATVPYRVLKQALKHPLTDIGIERFLADWQKREER